MPTPIRTTADLARAIRERRTALSLTQADLAALVGTSVRFINELERDARGGAAIERVLLVCERLGLVVELSLREDAR